MLYANKKGERTDEPKGKVANSPLMKRRVNDETEEARRLRVWTMEHKGEATSCYPLRKVALLTNQKIKVCLFFLTLPVIIVMFNMPLNGSDTREMEMGYWTMDSSSSFQKRQHGIQ